jgi:hypothetical protein
MSSRITLAMSGKKIILEKSLSAVNPKLAKEWHPTKKTNIRRLT